MSPKTALLAALAVTLSLAGCDAGPQLFHDVAREQRLDYTSYSGDRLWYLLDTMGSGVAAGDYDGDGDPDLFLLTGSAILDSYRSEAAEYRDALWRNNGDGTFTDVTVESGVGVSGWSNGVVFSDHDGDGDLDAFVARHGPNLLWRNNGDGTFTDVAAEAGVDDARWGSTGCFADFDGDGYLDLYVANYAEFVVEEQKGTVTGFKSGMQQFPQHFEPTDNVLYRNNGDGTFSDVTAEAGVEGTGRSLGVLATDVDDDGDLDLFVANDIGFNDLYLNHGGLRFENVALEAGVACDAEGRFQACMGVAAADHDADGDLDIMVTNYGGEYHTLYRNEGEGFFSDVTDEAGLVSQATLDSVGWGLGIYDFDLDGKLDILSVNGHVVSNFVLFFMRHFTDGDGDIPQMAPPAFNAGAYQPKHLFLGKGDGTFVDFSAASGEGIRSPRMSRGAAFADFDRDGKIDVAVSNKNDAVQVLLNRMPVTGHWIRLSLRAAAPNVFAIGARVVVHVGNRREAREVRSSSSYLSADELALHFGLGAADRVERVAVRWPDGARETFVDLEADREHVLTRSASGKLKPRAHAGTVRIDE